MGRGMGEGSRQGAGVGGGGDPRWRGQKDGAALTSMRLAGESLGTFLARSHVPASLPPSLASQPGGPSWDWLGGGGRGRGGGRGGEACEQSVISGCSGRRRKRELGIAAPSPFTYFLSPRGPPPSRRPGGGAAGAAANRPAVRAWACGERRGRGRPAPGAPAPSSSPPFP